jgi:hypothetical protein
MTEKTAAGTDVVQVAPGALALVKGREPWTVIDLAALVADQSQAALKKPAKPVPAAAVKFTDPLRAALKALPAVFGKITPTETRKLEAAELTKLTEEALTIDALLTELGERRKAISEIVRTHQDEDARDRGLVTDATEQIASGVAKGHYLLADPGSPFETPVEGYKGSWQQRYVKGGVEINGGTLDKLLEAGEIDRQAYLACTSAVRVYDPMRTAEYIRKNPVKGLGLLRRITTTKPPSASLYAPKN